VLRYWDGEEWSGYLHVSAGAPLPRDAVDAERRAARWVRLAWLMYPVVAIGSAIASLFTFDWLLSHLDRLGSRRGFGSLGPWPAAIGGQIGGPLALAVVVVTVVWSYQAARAGETLGLPARRSPGWVVAGWLLPVINLWWPYQSVRDLATDRSELQPQLGWWWASYVLTIGSPVLLFALVAASSVGVAAYSIPIVALASLTYALLGRYLAARIMEIHERELVARRLDGTPITSVPMPARTSWPASTIEQTAIAPQLVSSPGTNGFAVASLVLGITWVFFLGSILAVIFGHVALRDIKRTDWTAQRSLWARNQWMAIIGLILGYVGILVLVVALIET
jgi:hypothetical protein